MDKVICGLLFLAVLAYLAYRAYRFFVKNEISTCFGKYYRWQDEREVMNRANQNKIGQWPLE